MKKKSVAFWIFFILAVICIIYAVIVRSTGSGTSFFLMWAGIGIVLLLLGISFRIEFWKNVPHVVKVIGMVVVCIGIVSFVLVEGCVISQMHAKGKAELDYIIVLGAQVRENGPSPVLKYRLDKAVEYLEENPDTICIVSGGQGKNEPWSEADMIAINAAMANQLNEFRASVEKLMEEGASVGIVTNDFHVFRAKQIAKKYGLKDACGIAAGSSPLYLPNNMLREFFAEIKFLVF